MLGVVLFVRFQLLGTTKIVFAALFPAVLLSFVMGEKDHFGNLEGIFVHKNQLGAAGVALFYTSASLLLVGWWRSLSIAALFAALLAVVLSHSGTGGVTLAVSATFLFAGAVWISNRSAFFIIASLGTSALAITTLLIVSLNVSLTDYALDLLGKDTTLTGRTVLWRYGWLSFMDHFWLGVGYKAYMASTETTSGLIQYILRQRLPYLHNNWLDVAADLGLVGLLLFAAVLVSALRKTISAVLSSHSLISIWSLCFIMQTLATTLAEGPLFLNHSMAQVLIVVVYLDAVRRTQSSQVSRQQSN
jgi:O-antigen ligase